MTCSQLTVYRRSSWKSTGGFGAADMAAKVFGANESNRRRDNLRSSTIGIGDKVSRFMLIDRDANGPSIDRDTLQEHSADCCNPGSMAPVDGEHGFSCTAASRFWQFLRAGPTFIWVKRCARVTSNVDCSLEWL